MIAEQKIKIKLKLFETIACNTNNLTEKGYFRTPKNIAECTNEVYETLFNIKS